MAAGRPAPLPVQRRALCRRNQSTYSTMIVRVAVCFTDPDVAVTVAVVVVVLVVVDELDDPPQPENRPRPARLMATSRSSLNRFRFLKPRKQSAAASVVMGSRGRGARWSAAAVVDELMESEVLAEAPCETVIGLGLKVQLYPEGSPLHAKETVPVKLFCELTVNCVSPTVPV